MTGHDLTRVAIVRNEVEAEIVRGLLRTEGIECIQRPTNFAVGAGDGVAIGGPREILVPAEALEAARLVLAPPAE